VLLCLPHAGGSATAYAHWSRALPGADVVAVELPGRGERLRERPLDSMDALVTDLAGRVLPHAGGQFALFGHSMGALVAFELAHHLRRRYGLRPARLLVSGCAAPESPHRAAGPPRHRLPDGELWEEVRKLNGTADAVCDHEEIRRLCTAAIRADFALVENYRFEPRLPLDCPISVFGGIDDPEVEFAELAEWSAYTRSGHTVSTFPGDHFYLHRHPRTFLHVLSLKLATGRDIQNADREGGPPGGVRHRSRGQAGGLPERSVQQSA
jgi:medium-chain acyl-[acyl-carrier-protein] hydrolase